MGQFYSGISEGDLISSQLKMLKFGEIREDQVSMNDLDINNQLIHMQSEYQIFFQQKIREQQVDETSNEDLINQQDQQIQTDLRSAVYVDPMNLYENENLYELPNDQNFIHSNDFSSSDLDFKSDQEDPQRLLKPKLLMIHGFGGTGMVFYRMIGVLRKLFRITTIDLLGQGASGRPNFYLKTGKDSIQFMINSIEAWIQTRGYNDDNQKFYLMGHSLGGFLSTEYALKYPQFVKQLILLSPVGVPQQPADFNIDRIIQQQETVVGGLFFRTIDLLWDKHISPFSILRGSGFYGASILLGGYVQRRTLLSQDEEKEALRDLFQQIVTRPQSSEICVTMILKVGAWARDPLEFKIKDLSAPVLFMYGEYDWMTREAPDRLFSQGILKQGSDVISISKSGHMLFADNPEECALEIVNNLFGKQKRDQLEKQLSESEMQKQRLILNQIENKDYIRSLHLVKEPAQIES